MERRLELLIQFKFAQNFPLKIIPIFLRGITQVVCADCIDKLFIVERASAYLYYMTKLPDEIDEHD